MLPQCVFVIWEMFPSKKLKRWTSQRCENGFPGRIPGLFGKLLSVFDTGSWLLDVQGWERPEGHCDGQIERFAFKESGSDWIVPSTADLHLGWQLSNQNWCSDGMHLLGDVRSERKSGIYFIHSPKYIILSVFENRLLLMIFLLRLFSFLMLHVGVIWKNCNFYIYTTTTCQPGTILKAWPAV